jgi:4-methyl-5(b-hydroxyethyl)-thiazole monophosphate biosynthesis
MKEQKLTWGMKMKVLLFLAKGFETMEFSAFIDVLGWAKHDYHYDIDMVTCGFSKTVLSAFDIPVTVDRLIDEVYTDDYDALAIPGGFEDFGFYEEAYDEKLLDLIRDFDEKRKTVATVCVAALALGKSGILKGRNATTYHLQGGHRQKQLAQFGAFVVNSPIVIDDNVITSYCPETAPGVAFSLLERLTSHEQMQIVKEAMGFR